MVRFRYQTPASVNEATVVFLVKSHCQCSPVDGYRRFGAMYCIHLQDENDTFLRKVGNNSQDYTTRIPYRHLHRIFRAHI
jgi:hypothetical protein